MEYKNTKVTELKALARERGLRGYSRMRRAELVALLQNNPPPPSQMSTWEPIDDRLRPDRPRQPRQPPRTAGRGASARVGSSQSGGPKER